MDTIDDIKHIEILIKFDDDQNLTKAIEIMEDFKKKGLVIKYIVSPRLKGYAHSSYFLTDLVLIANPESKAFCNSSIDFVFIRKSFDTLLISHFDKYPDGIFTIHSLCCPSFISDIGDVNRSFQHVDNMPILSKKWLEIQSTYGYNSSCDGYVGMVEYFLATEWGMDRRIDITFEGRITYESGCPEINSKHWMGPRRTAMESHLAPQCIAFARQAAKNLALNIANAWSKDDYCHFLIQALLKAHDGRLIAEGAIHNYVITQDSIRNAINIACVSKLKRSTAKMFLKLIVKLIKMK